MEDRTFDRIVNFLLYKEYPKLKKYKGKKGKGKKANFRRDCKRYKYQVAQNGVGRLFYNINNPKKQVFALTFKCASLSLC